MTKASGGAVTDAELSRDNGEQVWDVSVDVGGGDNWELRMTPRPRSCSAASGIDSGLFVAACGASCR
jgi:hypothetical protein